MDILPFSISATESRLRSLAFYYRIFAIARFRSILIWIGILCVVYMVSIDLTILFQWYAFPAL